MTSMPRSRNALAMGWWLAFGHLLPAPIAAVGGDLERFREGAAPRGVGGKYAGQQGVSPVEAGGAAVRVADVRARPAADHAKAELAPSVPHHTRTPNSAISFCISRPPAIMSSTWSRAISVFRKVPIERPRLRRVKESPTG